MAEKTQKETLLEEMIKQIKNLYSKGRKKKKKLSLWTILKSRRVSGT